MAKKVTGFVKLQVPAGAANPAPPVGPALGQHGPGLGAAVLAGAPGGDDESCELGVTRAGTKEGAKVDAVGREDVRRATGPVGSDGPVAPSFDGAHQSDEGPSATARRRPAHRGVAETLGDLLMMRYRGSFPGLGH